MKKCRNFKRKLPNGATWSGGKYVGVDRFSVTDDDLLAEFFLTYPNDLLRIWMISITLGSANVSDIAVGENSAMTGLISPPIIAIFELYRNGEVEGRYSRFVGIAEAALALTRRRYLSAGVSIGV